MVRKEMILALLILFAAIPVALAVNEQPIAVAKVNPTGFYACECEGVGLDGSGSYDLDGWIADTDYKWIYNSQVFTGEKVILGKEFTQNPGTYKFILKVTDNGGATDTTEVVFRVWNNPRPQIEEIDWDIETEAENDEEPLVQGDKLSVEVDLVEKEYGNIIYSWNYNPEVFQQTKVRQTGDGQEITFEVISGGTGWKTSYEIEVVVSNACGEGDADDIEVKVKSSQCNSPPEAKITFLSSTTYEGESFRVDSASSTTGQDRNESDDEIVAWYWNITDEQGTVIETSTREDPRFRIEDPGIYDISLKVTDRFGATGETSESFRVENVENDYPPTADCSSTKKTATYGKPFELNGSGSNDNRDWDGRGNPEDLIGLYIWYIKLDEDIKREICHSKNPVCLTTFNRTGEWEIILEVRDTGDRVIDKDDDEINVLSNTDSIIINVTAAPEPVPKLTPRPTPTPSPTVTPALIPAPTLTPTPKPTPTLEKIPVPTKSFLENFWEAWKTIKAFLGINP